MFGRKKEVTQEFIEKTNGNQENSKEKMDNPLDFKDSDNYIFYGEDNKFSKQFEIYATLKDSNKNIEKDKLVLILIDSNSSIEYLSLKICENFSKFPEYQNLQGLRAINLTKLNDEKNLQPEEKVEKVLRNGDIIYLDLVSNDIWIKVTINMINVINKSSKIIVSMDVKIKNEITFKQLRYKLMKSGIMCYLDKSNKLENHFHYIVSEVNISTSIHGSIDENKLKSMDDLPIRQLFNFKSSIKIDIKFFPLEFILFQKLKILPVSKALKKKTISFEKFKQLKFRELLNSKKYSKEKKYIFNFFKNIFKSKDSLPKCYIYSIDEDSNTNTTENYIENNNININNSEPKEFDESLTLKINNQSNNQFNRSIFNWSEIDKLSETINISAIPNENEKIALIILPPKQDENNINSNKIKKKRSDKRKSTDRNLNYKLSNLDFGAISEENDDDYSNEKNSNLNNSLNKRKISDINYNDINKLKTSKRMSFEIITKENVENDMENEDLFLNLKPKYSGKKNKKYFSIKKNLCDFFDKYFEKEKFLDFLSESYLLNIEKGALENSTIPEFRKLKIDEKKIRTMNKRRKKKKLIDYSYIYKNVFSVSRLNIELLIFSIFIIAVLSFLSHLLADTYY